MHYLSIVTRFTFIAGWIFFTSCSNGVKTANNFEVVDLPDGSTAFLNHNSSLNFDEDFNPRRVEIQGEVFLSVTEGEAPFTVSTPLGEVEVLGTEFNVKTTADDLEVEVEEGTVELKTKSHHDKIGRGQRGSYHKGESEIKLGKAEFKFKIWIKSLEIEFEKLGREIKHGTKGMDKETRKMGKDLKKGLKKLEK